MSQLDTRRLLGRLPPLLGAIKSSFNPSELWGRMRRSIAGTFLAVVEVSSMEVGLGVVGLLA